jgi:hypothetical protein
MLLRYVRVDFRDFRAYFLLQLVDIALMLAGLHCSPEVTACPRGRIVDIALDAWDSGGTRFVSLRLTDSIQP